MASETTEQLELLVIKLEAHIEQLKVDAAMARQQLVNTKARLRQRKRRAGEEFHAPRAPEADPFEGLPDAYRDVPPMTAILSPAQLRLNKTGRDNAMMMARKFYLEGNHDRAEIALNTAHQQARGEILRDSDGYVKPNPHYAAREQSAMQAPAHVPLSERSPDDILAELMAGHEDH